MYACYPYAIDEAYQEAMQEVPARCVLGNEERANKKNGQPAYGLDIGGDERNSGKGHGQPKEGKAENKLPVHAVFV